MKKGHFGVLFPVALRINKLLAHALIHYRIIAFEILETSETISVVNFTLTGERKEILKGKFRCTGVEAMISVDKLSCLRAGHSVCP